MRKFGILAAVALAAARPSLSTDILHLDPQSQTASPPARPGLGLMGVNVHRFRSNAALDLARDIGFRFARADLLWERVERGGSYRFGAYEALMNALQERGMGVLWILDYGHPDHGGKVPRTPEDIAAFGRFAEAAANHFKGRDVRYEIWNEPDIEQFWPPKPNAQEYAAVLRSAVSAIRKADPAAKIVSGGTSRLDLKFLRKAVDPTLAADLTAIGIHPYPQGGPEKIGPNLDKLRDWARQSFGGRVEIWDTEWGYSSTNAAPWARGNGRSEEGRMQQALLAVREILTAWSVGFPLAVWYDLQDDGTDPENPEQNYGLLDARGAEKPAMQAVRTVMAVAKGRQYTGAMQHPPSGLHVMRFDGQADVLLIAWNDQGKRRTIEYPTNNLAAVAGMMGKPVEGTAGDPGRGQIDVNDASGPVYLRWKRVR